MKYQLENTDAPGIVLRVKDFGDEVPTVLAPEKNLRWVEYVVPTPTPPTSEQIAAQLEAALDRYIHRTVWERRFDRVDSLPRAAVINGARKAKALALCEWVEACYDRALEIQAEVATATRPVPTADELIAEMPALPANAGVAVRTWAGVF